MSLRRRAAFTMAQRTMPGAVRYLPYANYAVRAYQAARIARRLYRGVRGNNNAPQPQRGVVEATTAQGDRTNVNLKRKGLSKRAKRKRKWIRKVRKAVAADKPMRVLNRTNQAQASVSDAQLNADRGGVPAGSVGIQRIQNFPILTYSQSQTGAGQEGDDLNKILEVAGNNVNSDNTQTYKPRIHLQSFLYELMLRNFSNNALFVDVYYWKAKRNHNLDWQSLISATDAQIGDDNLVATAPGTFSAVEDYGYTPYQNPDFMKIVDIFKKERYFLPAGGVTQIEWRNRIGKNYVKDQLAGTLESISNKLVKNISMGVLLISYGVPADANNQRITGFHGLQVSTNKTIYWQDMTEGNAKMAEERAVRFYEQ